MTADRPMRLVPATLTHEMEARMILVANACDPNDVFSAMYDAAIASAPPVGEEVVERVARALYERECIDPTPTCWPTLTDESQENYREQARAILSAIEGDRT